MSDVGYSFWEKDTLLLLLGLSYPASSSQDLHSDRSIDQEGNRAAEPSKDMEHTILPTTLSGLYWFPREWHFGLYI